MKKYRHNTETRQIHRREKITPMCRAGNPGRTIPRGFFGYGPNWKECNGFVAWLLLAFFGYDGCGHCWPEKSKVNGTK
jgi:hypothetical protein